MAIPGTNIRLLRKQFGLSLKALAAAAEIDQGNLSKLERGEAGYSHETIERIANALHVSVGVLFAQESAVEAAALRMREVPVLTPDELLFWRGKASFHIDDERRTLQCDLDRVSPDGFAITVLDELNEPWFSLNDELVFDAARNPKPGDIVIAQEPSGKCHIGRIRILPDIGSKQTPTAFEIVPFNLRAPAISSAERPRLVLRGTLCEHRRYF